MDARAKQVVLRMIPYGLYILTAENKEGRVGAAAVNWVTQASFEPPLLAVGVKADSGIHALIKESRIFALNVLDKDQASLAFTFFKPVEREGQKIGGLTFRPGREGAPILEGLAGHLECRLVDEVERGDHSMFVGEVIEAGLRAMPDGRPDEVTLWLKDLGERIFYGG